KMRDYDKEPIIVKNDRTMYFILYFCYLFACIWIVYAYIGDEKDWHTNYALGIGIAGIIFLIKQIIIEIKNSNLYTQIYNDKIITQTEYVDGKKKIREISKPYKVYWFFNTNGPREQPKETRHLGYYIISLFLRICGIVFFIVFFVKNKFKFQKYYVIIKDDFVFSVPASDEVKEYFGEVGFYWKL
ncbi:hypothetical protein, partial [Campylobacter sp.]|uniref:hypothetical protein n=1 Tax=Campylobacter sp. TaxID=205 RepID=UPI002AA8E4AF